MGSGAGSVAGGGRAGEPMSAVVALEGVTKCWSGGATALADLTLRVAEGVSYGLVGRNGAGKTTALRLVMGMLRPTAGSVRVFGLDPLREPAAVKARIGYLAEDQELPDLLTPGDLLRLFRDVYPTWDRGFEEELVGQLGLSLDRRIGSLSKGERRQAALVLALWLDLVSIPGLPLRAGVTKGVDDGHAAVHQEDD